MVAAGAALGIELLQRLGEPGERVVVVERAWYETESLGQPLPVLLPERCPAVVLDGLVHHLAEILGFPVPPGEAHQGEGRWQQPAIGQVVDGRYHLLAGQIAGHTENHYGTWPGDSGQPLIALVPQRVLPLPGAAPGAGRAHFARERS